jgi:hypothetical protein
MILLFQLPWVRPSWQKRFNRHRLERSVARLDLDRSKAPLKRN